MENNRLPTEDNLEKREITQDVSCPLCNVGKEFIPHIFFNCDLAKILLFNIKRVRVDGFKLFCFMRQYLAMLNMVHTRALIHEMMFVVRNRISARTDINDVELTLSAAGAQRKNIPNVPHDLPIITKAVN